MVFGAVRKTDGPVRRRSQRAGGGDHALAAAASPSISADVAGVMPSASGNPLRGLVPRSRAIRYQGRDENGQTIDRSVSGFHARVVQHECDHLQGRLYPMRMRDFTKFGFTEVLFPGLE